jgi:cellulose synthase/poly-beta-1,6-N-acetylglucosamine synthase-like glycosyltransferase
MQILGFTQNVWDTWYLFLNLTANQTQLDTSTTDGMSILCKKRAERTQNGHLIPCVSSDLHGSKYLTLHKRTFCTHVQNRTCSSPDHKETTKDVQSQEQQWQRSSQYTFSMLEASSHAKFVRKEQEKI